MIDLHCHILPEVDDGAANLAESMRMAEGLAGLGFHRVCATPHIPWHTHSLSAPQIQTRCKEFSLALADRHIQIEVTPGAEHFGLVVPELLQEDGLVCFPRGDTFLMEFPLSGVMPQVGELLFRLQVKGKVPVIAHLERYPQVQKDPAYVARLKEQGCYALINLTSLVGKWDRKAQQAARELLKLDLVDAVTTDMHADTEIKAVEAGLGDLGGRVDAERVKRLTETAPAEIAGIES